jgi:hypothetical protein
VRSNTTRTTCHVQQCEAVEKCVSYSKGIQNPVQHGDPPPVLEVKGTCTCTLPGA